MEVHGNDAIQVFGSLTPEAGRCLQGICQTITDAYNVSIQEVVDSQNDMLTNYRIIRRIIKNARRMMPSSQQNNTQQNTTQQQRHDDNWGLLVHDIAIRICTD